MPCQKSESRIRSVPIRPHKVVLHASLVQSGKRKIAYCFLLKEQPVIDNPTRISLELVYQFDTTIVEWVFGDGEEKGHTLSQLCLSSTWLAEDGAAGWALNDGGSVGEDGGDLETPWALRVASERVGEARVSSLAE